MCVYGKFSKGISGVHESYNIVVAIQVKYLDSRIKQTNNLSIIHTLYVLCLKCNRHYTIIALL